MKKWLFVLMGVAVFMAGLYGPFYLAYEVLPEGWLETETMHWWSLPVLITLLCGGFGAVVLGVIIVATEAID